MLDEYESIRPYFHAFIEALARSARSPELRQQLAAHYNPQRDRVAGLLSDSLNDTIEPNDARHLASVMIATVDGLLIQTFIDPDSAPSSNDLATATGHAAEAEARRGPSRPKAKEGRRPGPEGSASPRARESGTATQGTATQDTLT